MSCGIICCYVVWCLPNVAYSFAKGLSGLGGPQEGAYIRQDDRPQGRKAPFCGRQGVGWLEGGRPSRQALSIKLHGPHVTKGLPQLIGMRGYAFIIGTSEHDDPY
eukprot:scaffold49784_cov18-Prasinocladus_malaysianus.AAC.1